MKTERTVECNVFQKQGVLLSADTVRQARQTDLVQWLRGNNVPLKKAGRWWYIEGHDSLRIQGNKWYRNSEGKGGNSIDFLVYYYQMTPKQAIILLTQSGLDNGSKGRNCGVKEKNEHETHAIANTVFDFASLSVDCDYRRTFAYLVKSRGVSRSVVIGELKSGHLYQEADTANAIFAAFDNAGTIVGAEVVGTLSYKNARYKGIKAGSLSGYGFNTGQRHRPRFILYFESAVDLLSFMSLRQSKSLNECLLISMAGLKETVVETALRAFGESAATPVFCVDNDAAADSFLARVLKKYPNALVKRPDCAYKDWNDQLRLNTHIE